MAIGVDEQPFPTHPHTPWRLILTWPARAPIVEMLYRTLRFEVNLDNITAERTSQCSGGQPQVPDGAGKARLEGSQPAPELIQSHHEDDDDGHDEHHGRKSSRALLWREILETQA